MNRWSLKHASIRHKLTALVLVSVTLALVLACAAFATNHYRFASQAMVDQLEALAELLGANCTAALVFDDADAAEQILSSLRKQPMVESAWVSDANGALFCAYGDAESHSQESSPASLGVEIHGDLLTITRPIRDLGERVGTIRLHASLVAVGEQLTSYLRIVLAVMLVSLVASVLLAQPMQRSLSGPILELAQTAAEVTENDDYSLRAKVSSEDEIGALCSQFNRMLERVEASENELQEAHDQLELRVEQRTEQLSRVNAELNAEAVERERAERELEKTHRELVDAARHAGMAEIATGVLHNVGNVLNSVNTSLSSIEECLRSPKRRRLVQVVDLFDSHRDRLGEFLTNDEQGKHVPDLLAKLVESLGEDDHRIRAETHSLSENIGHIKAIISTQQSFARAGGVREIVDVNAMLEDALRLNSSSFDKHGVCMEREFADLPEVVLDKQRLLQIVINLVKNAKEALHGQKVRKRVLTLRTQTRDDRLMIQVADTGVGIEPEALAKVFGHGYTTKPDGHGFGLHSCANAAREMGGQLTAESEGAMRGATFTLDLPFVPKESADQPTHSAALFEKASHEDESDR